MALFGGGKKSYIGLDLGTVSVKLAEMRLEKGKPRLVTYGFIDQSSNIVKNNAEHTQKEIVENIKTIVKESRITSTKVVAALPSYAVFNSIIALPAMSKKDLYSAVRWEAKKFVPMPLEEMVLDWRILEDEKDGSGKKINEAPPGPKKLKVLLTAAPKNLVKKYIEICKAAELQIVSLETESFALERSLIGNDKSTIMIVDIGGISTDISIIKNSVPILNRNIDVGGDTITKSIANALNIDLERAEQFKRDVGVADNPNSQIPKTIEFVISSIINEINYAMNLFKGQQEVGPVEKIILSGGSAFLPNLTVYLEKALNLKVIIGNPWARIVYPLDLKPVLDEIGPRFAVAVGLAIREIV
ncbi:MAG: type IV pilus assembly protein PilM [Patescibacteria group bacterium]